MKALAAAIVLVLVVNLLALIGFVAWLGASGRLSQERVDAAIAIFTPTIDEQAELDAEAEQLAEADRLAAEQAARLADVEDGPVTLEQRIVVAQQANDVSALRVDFLNRQIEDLKLQMSIAKREIDQQQEELTKERNAFEAYKKQQEDKVASTDFQQAVDMYAALKPKQSKQMFQNLLSEGKSVDVVDYLAALPTRKAAAILKEFKQPAEVTQATMLVEELRTRGVDPTGSILGAG